MVLLFLRSFFLLFLRLHLLIGDIGQRELLARWHEPYKGFLNVFLRTESRSFLHSLALERGFERTQIAKVHDVAIGNDVACRFCGKIENCCHFLRIESGRFSHSFAEILEVHTVSSRRLCASSKTKCNKRVALAERCRRSRSVARGCLHLSARKKKQPAIQIKKGRPLSPQD